jgi:hypothetical protein
MCNKIVWFALRGDDDLEAVGVTVWSRSRWLVWESVIEI